MNSRKSDGNNLAIIGASGTGKTTLAVGLYATSTESFTVAPDGDETRKYLEIRKTSIEEGFWPAATNESENFDLRLRLHASGRETDIVFREYMGERMERDPNYIREVIGTPKSAMILFNPGMPGLSKPETRNRMLGNLKIIAQHLKDNGCIAVAFVVTASDRLASDLAASREDFEGYASEVTNHLTNLGLDWKRFDVTVSGQLDDQNKPKLARGENNTTHEPFLWLLKRIRDSKRRKSLLTAVAVFATFLGVSGVVFGGLVVHSRQVLAKAEKAFANTTNALNIAYAAHDEAKVRTTSQFFETNSFGKITAILPSDRTRKQELINRASEQNDLWSVRLLSMELASNKSKIATKPSDVQLDWFEDFNKRLTLSSPFFGDAVDERDTLTNDWANSRIGLETKCQTEHYRTNIEDERKKLESYEPAKLSECIKKAKELIEDKDRIYIHVSNRVELCDRLGLISARTNAIARYVDPKIGKPKDEKRPDDTEKLRQSVSKDLKNALTTKEFDALSKIISERNDVALEAWDAFHFPEGVKKLEIALNAVESNPGRPLVDSLAFLAAMTNNYPTISQVEFIKARNTIEGARKKTIEHYENFIARGWDVNGKKPPEFDIAKIRNTILTQDAVTGEEYDNFRSDMNRRFTDKKQKWNDVQKKLVEDFAVDRDILTIVGAYSEFRDEWPQNPCLGVLDEKVNRALCNFFEKYIENYEKDFRGNNRIFSEPIPKMRIEEAEHQHKVFRDVLRSKSWQNSPLSKMRSGKFAKLCLRDGGIDQTAFNSILPQTLKIKKIEARFDSTSLDSDFSRLILNCKFISQRWNFQNGSMEKIFERDAFSGFEMPRKSFNNGWVQIPIPQGLEVPTNPFTETYFKFDYKEIMDDKTSINQDDTKLRWIDFADGIQTSEYNWNFCFKHSGFDDNNAGALYVRITFEGIGDDFKSLWKASQK